MTELLYSGPLDYLVFTFPAGARADAGLFRLLDAVDRGAIEVLDLEVVGRDADGHGAHLTLSDVASAEVDLSAFEGAESGILDGGDLEAIAGQLDPGEFALALVYLEHSLDATAQAWIEAGGRPLLEGGIDPEELAAALDSPTTKGSAS
jgi:hypothetical protein